ncbi:unnamed protein product [Ilex paraguariensis]|uniref:Uncharacterized protein n=1 Tax=Ilex paraguariensis TaxID=185542 RepID=A0ABC8RWJ6_9AQUA
MAISLACTDVDRMFGVIEILEQSIGYVALAYGYLTGWSGILLVVYDLGYVHGLAVLFNASVNAWPLVMTHDLQRGKLGRPNGFYLDLPSDVLHPTIIELVAEKLITDAPNCRNEEEEVMGTVGHSEIEKAFSMLRKAEGLLIVFGKALPLLGVAIKPKKVGRKYWNSIFTKANEKGLVARYT